MIRRIHIPELSVGPAMLPPAQARYLRDVLRLTAGTPIEAFDARGNVGGGEILEIGPREVRIRIDRIKELQVAAGRLVVAAALPKAARADWMIEKLGELGVDEFVPLAAERSVVLPDGQKKFERWRRLASESARQSRRTGIMQIGPLTNLNDWLASAAESTSAVWQLSTDPTASSIFDWLPSAPPALSLLIGPEGGWSESEIASFNRAGIIPLRLTPSILRVETAAVAAAAIVLCATSRATTALAGDQNG